MGFEAVSLFTGAMGLDLGLEQVGIRSVVCAECDESCRLTIDSNSPYVKVIDDVRKVTAQTAPSKPFLVHGGPPCQSFSTMGKRLAFSDPRGMLAYEFGRVVDELRPRFFVMENVKGMLSAKVPWDPSLSVIDELERNFGSLGYRIVKGVVDAVNYGVPQFRERVLLIGSRDGEDVFLPSPTHFPCHQREEFRYRVLKDVLPKEPTGLCLSFSDGIRKYLVHVKPGENWRSIPQILQKQAMGGVKTGGNTGFYRRLSMDEPSPTLVTSPVQKATLMCHPEEDRPLSLREYARIQQFPDSWVFRGTLADCYRQVGNAVPIGLGKAIGESLMATLTGGFRIYSKQRSEGDRAKAVDESTPMLDFCKE
jgi:DNA (cytosine-5)-methyltransferase 1